MRKLVMTSAGISVEGAPEKVVLIPLGEVSSQKGPFLMDALAFKEIQSHFASRGIDVVVDYEHQTLTGGQAPAAGWVTALELTDQGVEGTVRWTEQAKQLLHNREYRYLSPVILKRKSDGRAVRLHSVALTNTPAIDGMVPMVNSWNGLMVEGLEDIDFEEEDEKMDLKQMALTLGLKETATEAEVLAEMQRLKAQTQLVANKAVLQELDLEESASLEDVKGALLALKNPAGYVAAEAFRKLQEKVQRQEQQELVTLALSEGKITPAQKDWAEEYALKDPEAFRKFLEKAPKVVLMDDRLPCENTGKKTGDELEMKINSMLGITQEEVNQYGKEEA